MERRPFGKTGLLVSERSFGGWAIGGEAYGRLDDGVAERALARAEELGCNFVDVAAVYGDAENVLGRFLEGRRDKWIVATKFSEQPEGIVATVEQHLKRLRVEHIDFYQIHWAPSRDEEHLYAALETLKRGGKIRFAGVSLRNAADVARVLEHRVVDGVQMPVSLLDPAPLTSVRDALRARGTAVIARSPLRSGFLSGRYAGKARFEDPNDRRSKWSAAEIDKEVRQAAAFAFLATGSRSLREAAIAYPLSFPEVATVIVGCKSVAQAEENFASAAVTLSPSDLERIATTQRNLGLGRRSGGVELLRRAARRARSLVGRLRRRFSASR